MKKTASKIVILLLVTAVLVLLLNNDRPGQNWLSDAPKGDIYAGDRKDVATYITVADYQQRSGNKIDSYKESPVLAEMVKAGTLEPVEKRLPDEPMVVAPVESIGVYGGKLRVNDKDWRSYMHHGLFRRNSEGTEILPDIAKGYKFADDYMSVEIYLRAGMRWSDGQRFTVDDILFLWDDEINNRQLNPAGPYPPFSDAKIVKIDDYTFRIDFLRPQPGFMAYISQPYTMGQSLFFNPKHYLKKWHLKYNPAAQALAESEGFDTWAQAFLYHSARWKFEQRPDLPTLNPWVVTQWKSTYGLAERNPYFWQVDTEGNQLPYIDKLLAVRAKREDTQSKIILMLGKQLDHLTGFGDLSIEDYPFLKKNEAVGDYRVITHPSTMRSAMTISFNSATPDPQLNKILNNLDFRKAVSLSIDRTALNNTVFLGLGTPRQLAPLPNVSFYKEWWGDYCIEYAPDAANALLDKIGLVWDDARQYRKMPDGSTLDILLESGHGTQIESFVMEVLVGQFKKVGIKITIKPEVMAHQRLQLAEYELLICDNGGREVELYYEGGEDYFMDQGYGWNQWLTQWIDTGKKPQDIDTGVEPPIEWKQLAKLVYAARYMVPKSPQWIAAMQQIYDFRVTNLDHIGIVYRVPVIDMVSNRIKNYPLLPWYGWDTGGGVMTMPQQWYFATDKK